MLREERHAGPSAEGLLSDIRPADLSRPRLAFGSKTAHLALTFWFCYYGRLSLYRKLRYLNALFQGVWFL